MMSQRNSLDSETGALPKGSALIVSMPASDCGYDAHATATAPLGVLPVQATLTQEQRDSLRRQVLHWKGMDEDDHRRAHAPIDLMARAWREEEYRKLAIFPTPAQLAELLDKLAVALHMALPSAETLAVYFEELGRIPLPLLQAGLSHLMRSYKYARFPPIAELLASIDEAAVPLVRDLRLASALCWKVERFLIAQLPSTQRERERHRWLAWTNRFERPLSVVAGPFAPPSPESRTASRSR